MPQYTVVVHWPQGREWVIVDTELPLQIGDSIKTYEKWPDYERSTEYTAKVVRYNYSKSEIELVLEYLPELNALGQASENRVWGISSLAIDLVEMEAAAEWSDVSDSGQPVKVKAQLIEEDLYEDLGQAWYKRRLRKQSKFRKELLQYGARCALTSCTVVEALDAAHIIDANSQGGFRASNGLMLRADLHRLYDAGILLILCDGTVAWRSGVAIPDDYLAASGGWKLQPDELRRVSRALARREPRDAN